MGDDALIIGHVSDLHVSPGRPGFGGIDALATMQRTIDYFASLPSRPDFVALTGDVADTPEGYVAVRDAFNAAHLPVLACVGNHDDRASFAEVLGYNIDAHGFIQYGVDHAELRVVVLDSKREDHGDGLLCDIRLDWLEAELARTRRKPTVLMLHHPPIATGLWWPDGPGLGGAARLERIVRSHSEIVAVLCGHVHTAASAPWAGTTVQIAPSTYWTAALDLGDEIPFRALVESPRVMLHRFIEGQLVSHVATASTTEPTAVDLMGGWDNMRTFMVALKAQRQAEERGRS